MRKSTDKTYVNGIPLTDILSGTLTSNQRHEFNQLNVLPSTESTLGDLFNGSWINRPVEEGDYDSLIVLPFLPMSRIGLIVSECPNESTISSYYLMILKNNVDLVLHISNISAYGNVTDMHTIGEELETHPFSRALVQRRPFANDLIREDFDLSFIGISYQTTTKRLTQIELKDFSLSSDDSIDRILKTVTCIRQELDICRENLTMIVHDNNNGVSEAAIVIALLFILEDLDEALESCDSNDVRSERIDIFKVVDELRGKRLKMVDTFQAYDFIYKAVAHYGQNKSKYDELLKFHSDESDSFERENGKTDAEIDVDQIPEVYVLP